VTCEKVTICEIHRRIYDRVFIALANQPEELAPIVKDLETAFALGVKMNLRLAERRLGSLDDLYPVGLDALKTKQLRTERERLTRMVRKQREWVKNYMDS